MHEPINDDPVRSLRAMRWALALSSFPIGVLTLGIPFYGRGKLGLDPVQIGVLVSIYALMTLLMRPIVGPAGDYRVLADIQNARAYAGFSGMDPLRRPVRQKPVPEDRFAGLLGNHQEAPG